MWVFGTRFNSSFGQSKMTARVLGVQGGHRQVQGESAAAARRRIDGDLASVESRQLAAEVKA
jgi:hypothetical protein